MDEFPNGLSFAEKWGIKFKKNFDIAVLRGVRFNLGGDRYDRKLSRNAARLFKPVRPVKVWKRVLKTGLD